MHAADDLDFKISIYRSEYDELKFHSRVLMAVRALKLDGWLTIERMALGEILKQDIEDAFK